MYYNFFSEDECTNTCNTIQAYIDTVLIQRDQYRKAIHMYHHITALCYSNIYTVILLPLRGYNYHVRSADIKASLRKEQIYLIKTGCT